MDHYDNTCEIFAYDWITEKLVRAFDDEPLVRNFFIETLEPEKHITEFPYDVSITLINDQKCSISFKVVNVNLDEEHVECSNINSIAGARLLVLVNGEWVNFNNWGVDAANLWRAVSESLLYHNTPEKGFFNIFAWFRGE